ncbi:MAG: trans-sulfuration enzyme family protein [Hyphomicrobiaceae bacterium]
MGSNISPEVIAVQGGGDIDTETGAVIPPVHMATTYERDPDNSYSRGYVYGRPDNPGIARCERVINTLEGGAATIVLPSGMTAATFLFLALDRPAHIVAPTVMYWGLRKWLINDAPGFGIETTFVDGADPSAVAAAIKPGRTKLVWLETPSNPLWSISDIAGTSDVAHRAGALVGVDSTAATPVLTRPLELGADVVMHSATKYLNGHSDVLAGSLTFASDGAIAARVRGLRGSLGAILGPMEAALLLRGMRTLFVRVRHQSAAALEIARAMAVHPNIADVLYPGLERHPAHALASRQMRGGFGGMLSIRCAGGEAHAIATAARLQVWVRATSLGGIESLVEHRASIEGSGSPCPPDLLRLSVGLEPADVLIDDLSRALSA